MANLLMGAVVVPDFLVAVVEVFPVVTVPGCLHEPVEHQTFDLYWAQLETVLLQCYWAHP